MTLIAPCAVLAAGCGLLWWVFGRVAFRGPDFITGCLAVTGIVLIAKGMLALRDRRRFLSTYVAFCRQCKNSNPLPDTEFAAELEDCDPEVATRVRKSMALFFGVPSEMIHSEQQLDIKSWHSPFRMMYKLGVDEVLASPEVQGKAIGWFPPEGPLVSDYVRSLCVAIEEFRRQHA